MTTNKRKPTVGLIAPFFLPEIGGANFYCYEIARAISAKGFDVHVFAKPGDLEDPAYTLHPILTLELEEDLTRLCKFQMDIWHSLYFYYAPLALYHSNVFVTGHGDDFFSGRIQYTLPTRRWLERNIIWRVKGPIRSMLYRGINYAEQRYNKHRYVQAIQSLRRVIAVSQFSKARFCEKYPGAKEKTDVIPPGVNERFFAPNPNLPEPNLFLTVTRLDEEDRIKNVHGVIHALAQLKNQYQFRYIVVVGAEHGRYRDEIKQLISQYELQNHVRIEARKPFGELLESYQKADLFILVSYAEPKNFEGFGIVFLEANAAGAPVLTSREGGMSDYVQSGLNGFYVDDPSPDGIKKALKLYLDGNIRFDRDRVRLAPLAYRWPAIADRVIELYESPITK